MATNYRKYYFSQPTEKLLGIYQNNRGKYEDEVYNVIEKILEERNVDFAKIEVEPSKIENKEVVKDNMIYSPMILGIINRIGIINLHGKCISMFATACTFTKQNSAIKF
ncbi:MAG: hypothetical protein WDM90_17080 [Ferruginibacter sp.]